MRVPRLTSGDLQRFQAPASAMTGAPWLWVAGFAAAAWLLARHALTPIVPGTTFSLISLPVALLAFVLMVRPLAEAPLYARLHAAAALAFHAGIEYPAFAAARVSLEIVEAVLLAGMLHSYFLVRLGDPAPGKLRASTGA